MKTEQYDQDELYNDFKDFINAEKGNHKIKNIDLVMSSTVCISMYIEISIYKKGRFKKIVYVCGKRTRNHKQLKKIFLKNCQMSDALDYTQFRRPFEALKESIDFYREKYSTGKYRGTTVVPIVTPSQRKTIYSFEID